MAEIVLPKVTKIHQDREVQFDAIRSDLEEIKEKLKTSRDKELRKNTRQLGIRMEFFSDRLKLVDGG